MNPPLSYRAHARSVLSLGLPLIGSHLAQIAIGITDTVMLGWYSVEALAAQVIAGSLFFAVFILGSGFGLAVIPLVAEAAASADTLRIRRVTRMALWLSALFALASVPLFWFSGALLSALDQGPRVTDLAQVYLRIAGYAMLPALTVMVLKGYLSALERTSIVFWSTVGAAIANAIGNYFLIFGIWIFPELGIAGAAIASLATNALGALILIIYTLRRLPEHHIFRRLWRPDGEVFRQVLFLGIPVGLTLLAEVGLFSASAVMVGWVGLKELAAHGIALQIASITFMVHLGLGGAATIRAGQSLGSGNRRYLRDGALVVLGISFVFSLLTIILFLSIPETLISLFLDPENPERGSIIAIGVTLLALAALFQLADGAQAISIALLRGLQDARVPMIYATVSYWLIGVPCSYVLSQPLGLGAPGVWLGLTIGLAAAALLLNLRFWRSVIYKVGASDTPAVPGT